MSTPIEVKVPDIGDFTDIPVIEVMVKAGDTVQAEDALISLESDKATMDVPAPFAGLVKEIRVKVGDKVSQGSVILLAEEISANDAYPSASAPAAMAQTSGGAKAALGSTGEAPASGSGPAGNAQSSAPKKNADGREALPAGVSQAATLENAAPPTSPPGDAADQASARLSAESSPTSPPHREGEGASTDEAHVKAHASPSVRRFARELGVTLGAVTGSGPKNRIVQEDVLRYVKGELGKPSRAAAPASSLGAGLDLLPWPKVDFAKFGQVEAKPLSRIKKIAGANLARNWVMIPHVTQFDAADITDLEAFRQQVNEENAKARTVAKLTMLAFLIKAGVAALKEFPEFNASLDGENLVLKHYFHLGFAADTPNGLVVPVIKDADKKGVHAIAVEMAALAGRARDGKLGPTDMQGGSFSISSLGGIGGTAFTPIINAPEVAILGVSRAAMAPRWNGRKFAPRLMLPLSLSYDHRVIDGAAAARFTTYLAATLGDMRRVLL